MVVEVLVGLLDLFNQAEFSSISLPGFMINRPWISNVIRVVQVGRGGLHVLGTRHVGLVAIPGVFQNVGQHRFMGMTFPEPGFVMTKGFGFVALVAFPLRVLRPPLLEVFRKTRPGRFGVECSRTSRAPGT